MKQAVVIGSGFGGAVSACRLAQRWGDGVTVLERGKHYPMGSFPRSPNAIAHNFWNIPSEKIARPQHMGEEEHHGLFDIRTYRKLDVVLSAGLGGGSLIYANVFMEPPAEVFDARWPAGVNLNSLHKYYAVAKKVLGARPIPVNDDPRRRIRRTEIFQKVAALLDKNSQLTDIAVFFGNDEKNPLPIGHQQKNRYGALQTSCTYCAECDIGCNSRAKNTLDLNYLHVAEHCHGARIETKCLVDKIVPLDKNEQEDTGAEGEYGFRVHFRRFTNSSTSAEYEDARRVIVAAGSLGTTELLLRCKRVYGTLPQISDRLGQSFSGNGDFFMVCREGMYPIDPTYGPVITQRIDFNLFDAFDPEQAFIIEDASYPNHLAWLIEGVKPRLLWLPGLKQTFRAAVRRMHLERRIADIGFIVGELLKRDLSYRSNLLLCMGLDRSNGVMSLARNGRLIIRWPTRQNMVLYRAILAAGKRFAKAVNAKRFYVPPSWWWPFRKNVTVHALGGCALADEPRLGVTSAAAGEFGRVFGYKNLFVADGSLAPGAIGANPSATIAALAERVAEEITHIVPHENLGCVKAANCRRDQCLQSNSEKS